MNGFATTNGNGYHRHLYIGDFSRFRFYCFARLVIGLNELHRLCAGLWGRLQLEKRIEFTLEMVSLRSNTNNMHFGMRECYVYAASFSSVCS